MSRGWKREPLRHRLSALGISTTAKYHRNMKAVPPKEFFPYWDVLEDVTSPEKKETEEMKKLIKLFWWCSVNNNWEWFDFERMFESVAPKINHELKRIIEWIIGEDIQSESLEVPPFSPLEEQKEDLEKAFLVYDKLLEGKSTKDDRKYLKDFMFEYRQGEFIGHVDVFHNLMHPPVSLEDKISLADSIIHLEHHRGNFWMINIPYLRKQFEEEYL
ncbi:hypothetical protein AKJ51_01415 [candidate division MSBL1 archaeon SCGC-AAA382A20]|uniref:Uncharacterized protein n=1 Tax=candidate division MSBL1 archaeon SCGC-AAA382A20 TaxID=1698280 RepID=A0A133VLS1_9EURY|nr:hypothetical protein AKJ51_01415 [candidate division MSBL1 archaeon SCGC-AAA382A20]